MVRASPIIGKEYLGEGGKPGGCLKLLTM